LTLRGGGVGGVGGVFVVVVVVIGGGDGGGGSSARSRAPGRRPLADSFSAQESEGLQH